MAMPDAAPLPGGTAAGAARGEAAALPATAARLAALYGGAAPKAWTRGTHRTAPPAATLARVQRLMPVMGISRIADVTGLDIVGLPVTMVVRPNARSVSVSQGKGPDMAAAQASGLMEAVELFHAERVLRPLLLASLEELRYTHALLDPARLPRGLERLDRHRRLLWIEGRSLPDGAGVWLPFEAVHTDFTVPAPAGSGCFAADSNGLASGNHPLEAIAHGLCELIERDALARWHRLAAADRAATRLDPALIADADGRAALAAFDRAGVAVAVWEATSAIGVPVILARVAERADPPRVLARPAAGSGCHPDRAVALVRALTEAAQVRLTLISGARDDLPEDDFADPPRDVLQEARAEILAPAPTARPPADGAGWTAPTCAEDVARILACLSDAGLDRVAVVDLSRPELFGVPVVRVVVPGLLGVSAAGLGHGARPAAGAGP
jgi:ribosomal protein S12 methylthiotransferase accessory factor